jgi:hypothetical protein
MTGTTRDVPVTPRGSSIDAVQASPLGAPAGECLCAQKPHMPARSSASHPIPAPMHRFVSLR